MFSGLSGSTPDPSEAALQGALQRTAVCFTLQSANDSMRSSFQPSLPSLQVKCSGQLLPHRSNVQRFGLDEILLKATWADSELPQLDETAGTFMLPSVLSNLTITTTSRTG